MDSTVHKQYEEILRGIVAGARRTSPIWPSFFSETNGDFETRIRQAFDASGFVPSRTQFEREKAALIYSNSFASVVEEVPDIPAPKKKAKAKTEEPVVEQPAATETSATETATEETTDENA